MVPPNSKPPIPGTILHEGKLNANKRIMLGLIGQDFAKCGGEGSELVTEKLYSFFPGQR